MGRSDPLGPFTSRVALPDHAIDWYRTKLPAQVHAQLHKTSDLKAWVQALSFLGMLAAWFVLALQSYGAGRYACTLVCVALYGMQANFLINGMHELGHGFVFKTKFWNGFFLRIISFLGWLHPDMFFSSHLRYCTPAAQRSSKRAPTDLVASATGGNITNHNADTTQNRHTTPHPPPRPIINCSISNRDPNTTATLTLATAERTHPHNNSIGQPRTAQGCTE